MADEAVMITGACPWHVGVTILYLVWIWLELIVKADATTMPGSVKVCGCHGHCCASKGLAVGAVGA